LLKRTASLTAIVLVVAWAGSVQAQGIDGSAHDFVGAAWYSGDEICAPCHIPHAADVSVTDAPLWNHDVTSASFTDYDSSTLDADLSGDISGKSKLCLSCHDGTVALDSFGGATGSSTISGSALIDDDLSDDHPVSFVYDATLATTDGDLVTPSSGSAVGSLPLFDTKMECATCHDVHNGVSGTSSLLRLANTGSALCLNCHNK
jgi:predicted CXXCH cytochrome family protein